MAMPLSGDPCASVDPASKPTSISEHTSAGPNSQRHLDQERRQENHFGDAEGSADEGGDDGDAERGAAFALLGQRKSVETGHRMRRMARQIEQDRADRPAILGAVIDAGKHQDCGHRLHAEGQRQQDRDRGDRRPCPAARRPGCRPARRGSSTSGCAARARRRSRTRDSATRPL